MMIDSRDAESIFRAIPRSGLPRSTFGSAGCYIELPPEAVSALMKSVPDCQQHTWSSRSLPHMYRYNTD